MDLEQLTDVFRRLGARDPESWASSQISGGIPQLARFVFLTAAWTHVVEPEGGAWIEEQLDAAVRWPQLGGHPVAAAIHALRAKGAADHELTALVRGMQSALLFNVCYQLDAGGASYEDVTVRWELAQVDEQGQRLGSIDALHESLCETDPAEEP
ncbi:MAG: hypothetical protein R3F05_20595 [Planctomycetota bacterium]